MSERFGVSGTANSPATGYPGINAATSVTIDGAGTAWIANCRWNCGTSGSTAADNIVYLSAAGTSLTVSDGFEDASLKDPTASAIDLSGNLWISNTTGGSLTELVGVAAPVVTELFTASSLAALPAVNYLQNPGFELGGIVKADSSANAIPSWTYASSMAKNPSGSAGVDNGSPFSGNQKFTMYNCDPYEVTESQTVAVPNGNYLVTCFVAGDPGSTTRTASITVSGYNSAASTLSNPLTNLSYSFAAYSVPNVPVSNGSLTVNLTALQSSGGYIGWDACSVTKQ